MDSKIPARKHSYYEIKKLINELSDNYSFINPQILASSSGGREIPAVSIGQSSEYVLYISSFSGTDRLVTLILLRFLEEFAGCVHKGDNLAGVNIRGAMFGRGIIILPLINPDGYEIALRGRAACGNKVQKIEQICQGNFSRWRANLRGVEISKNFSYDFDERRKALKKLEPSASGFCGYKAESEPETLAVTDLCRKVKIRHVINLNIGEEGIFYGKEHGRERSVKMAEIMASVTGFTINVPTLISPTDFKDWFTYEFARPAFTISINGTEKNLDLQYEKLKELLTLSALM